MHVILTGASSGIGEALAREYLQRGASLTLVARRKAKLQDLARGSDGRCHVVEADLSDHAHASDWVDGAVAALGPVDVLINNAGAQIVGPTASTAWQDGERILRLNELSPLRLITYVLPAMLARKQGTIVNVSSMSAIMPMPAMLFYNASKAALAAASESLRGELRGTGVRVMTVYPGPVQTGMAAASSAAYEDTRVMRAFFGRAGQTSVLARMVADGVTSGRARVIYPRSYAIARRFPNVMRVFLDRFTPPVKASEAAR